MAAGIALSAKRKGKCDSLPDGAAKQMCQSMSLEDLEHYAGIKRKGLPKLKRKKK